MGSKESLSRGSESFPYLIPFSPGLPAGEGFPTKGCEPPFDVRPGSHL
jgi:hypothetical protein